VSTPPSAMSTAGSASEPRDDLEAMRIRYAFWLSIIGLALAGALVVVLVAAGWKQSSDVAAVVGLFTSVLGTLVGAFFGFQVGSAGKEREQRATAQALRTAYRALAALPPEQARQIVE
jgi:uncharacterized membrane protein